ncbi:Hsp20/alpha crystallin family protein [Bdellovibrionota bacterium FG-1]
MAIRNMLPSAWRGERSVWNPMREMNRLQRRMDRMFQEFLPESFSSMTSPAGDLLSADENIEFTPACDIAETKSHYLVTFDLPGMKKSDVKIDLQDNQLTVSGERKHETHEEEQGRVSRERYYGAFCRAFTLPSKVNADKVEANYENGVLQIAIPKTEVSVGKQIPIKEGKLLESKATKAA